jgi:hypothetical protein
MTTAPRTVQLAGLRLGLRATTSELDEFLQWHFGRLPETSAPADLSIVAEDMALTPPPQPPTMHDGPITRWEGLGADLVLWHEQGSGAWLRDDTLLLGISAPPDRRWRVLRHLVFSALSWFFERRGVLILHAAMVARDGEAVLLVGPTGAGKSTAAVAALLDGWEMHSDDLAVVRPGPDGPLCCGIPKRPSVDPDLAPLLGIGLEPLPDDGRGRRMLPADALSVGERLLRAVVSLGHDRGEGVVEPLAPDECLAVVVPASLEATRPGVLGRHLPLLAALAARPGFRLAHAASPEVRAERAARMLQQVWDASDHGSPADGVPAHEHPQ